MDTSLLSIFIPTFFLVSLSPGLCMTLALTLGLTLGLRKTFYMMWGELLGVALVSLLAVLGVASVMFNYPEIFAIFKWLGGSYLVYLGIMMWLSKGHMTLSFEQRDEKNLSHWQLSLQGFVTAVANPKGWAFTLSLLPPFIELEKPLIPQLSVLITLIIVIEFICLTGYALGGSRLRELLQDAGKVKLLNKTTGCLMMGVGFWLALG